MRAKEIITGLLCFGAAAFLYGAAIDTDGNPITPSTDIGDIDADATTVQDLKDVIAPGVGVYYAASSTAAGTAAKAASTERYAASTSDNDFVLTNGCVVVVKFAAANTAESPTLNVNGTGAKSIYRYGSSVAADAWYADEAVSFVYDGVRWLMLKPAYAYVDSVATQKVDKADFNEATNALAEAIAEITPEPSKPCPVSTRSWNRPNEWTIDYAPDMSEISSVVIDLITDSVGIVYSNVLSTTSRGLTARIYSEVLDPYAEITPPSLASIIVSGGGSAVDDVVTVPTSGLYKVRGIANSGEAREISVAFAADAHKVTRESYYLSDTNLNRKAVNNYAATTLSNMEEVRTGTDPGGNAYTIYSTCLPGFGAKNGSGQFSPYAIAPKFAATAHHYPWVDCQNQTYTVNGQTFTITRGAPTFCLATWALTNGFTQAEVTACGATDIEIIPLAEGKQFPAEACPYIATTEWIERNYQSLKQLVVWTVSQTSEYGIPTVITGDGSSGTLMRWLSAGALMPSSVRPRIDLVPLIGEYNERGWWRIQMLDSGKPVWMVDQSSGTPRPILISHFEYTTGGPNYTAAARIIAALCAAYNTPLKLLQ